MFKQEVCHCVTAAIESLSLCSSVPPVSSVSSCLCSPPSLVHRVSSNAIYLTTHKRSISPRKPQTGSACCRGIENTGGKASSTKVRDWTPNIACCTEMGIVRCPHPGVICLIVENDPKRSHQLIGSLLARGQRAIAPFGGHNGHRPIFQNYSKTFSLHPYIFFKAFASCKFKLYGGNVSSLLLFEASRNPWSSICTGYLTLCEMVFWSCLRVSIDCRPLP